MPNSSKKEVVVVVGGNPGLKSTRRVSSGTGRRPATTNSTAEPTTTTCTTNTNTPPTTTNAPTNGNVNNNGRVNVPPANKGSNNAAVGARRPTNPSVRSRSNNSAQKVAKKARAPLRKGRGRPPRTVSKEEEESGESEAEDLEGDCEGSGGEGKIGGVGAPTGGGPSSPVSSENGSESPKSLSSEEEDEPASEECQSFFLIVTKDGTLVLDNSNQLPLEPGQERLAVSLPKNKIKSLENPFPGAIQLPNPRSRKSKPEGVTYGGSVDVGFVGASTPTPAPRVVQPVAVASTSSTARAVEVVELELGSGTIKEASMSVGINPAQVMQPQSQITMAPGATTGPIDMDEFTNQLDPQSLATLETLIQSAQGSEIIENLDLDQVASVHISEPSEPVDPKPPGWDHGYTSKSGGGQDSSASVSVSSASTTSSAANSPGGPRTPARSPAAARSSSSGKDRTSSGGRLSECDGNIRRSQRQQDRIERQEAERIMAENQQMLQREKEIMKEASAQKIASPGDGSSPTAVVSKVLTPIRVASPIPQASPSARVASPEHDSKRPYPKRENRKLPAHLADPNYINTLDEEGVRLVKEGSSASEKSGGSRRSSIQAKVEEQEQPEAEGSVTEEGSADDGDDDYTEDDPNRLWCICRQPHNNRFMICCDKCEDWFHGKCVNVTKAQGKAMELKNIPWNCPPCRKLIAESEKLARKSESSRGRAISRRESESTGKSTGRLSKAAAAQQAEAAAAANAAKLAQTPGKIAAQSTSSSKRGNARKSESEKVEEVNVHDCVVCGKVSRPDSIYCSDLCVQKYANSVGTKSSQEQTPSIPTTPTSATISPGKDKLKRANSLKADQKPDEPIFAFHVISAGSSKSTEIVPPKPKELTASQLLKAQREQAAAVAAAATSPTKTIVQGSPGSITSRPGGQGVSPNSVNVIMSSAPTVVVKKMTTPDGKSFVKLPGKISKETPLKMETSDGKTKGRGKDKDNSPTQTRGRTRTSSVSTTETKSKPAVSRKSSLKSEKEQPVKEREGIMSEKLQRENMRKGLRELLKARLKEMSEEDQRKISNGSNNPETMAEKIEDELTRVYAGASNPKCRSKYRSIYFNLKDSKNCLYQEILNGNLKPKVLVKMEPHELASAELSEWRKRESEKDLEAIKKAELDKYAEAKKIELLEKGVDDAVVVAEESRPLDISDIIDTKAVEKDKTAETEKSTTSGDKSKSSSSSSHSHHSKSRSKDSSSRHSEKDRDRRDKDRRRSDRHKSDKDRESSSKDKDKSDKDRKTREKEKEKVKHSDNKDRDRRHSKGKESEKSKSASSKEEQGKSPSDSESRKSGDNLVSEVSKSGDDTPTSSQTTPPDSKKGDVRHSTDSEQELPSSTIKTPDFAEESSLLKKDSDSKPMFLTKIVMPELGGFNASAHAVSHFTTEGITFPESPVSIVGRISPETVWDYINKMKKSKEVIVYRLAPATPADSEGYMTFFSYFSSRERLGVIGGIIAPLKDVYVVPLDKHSPVNRALTPFRGPGLPKERTHCLLCVVTRHVQDPSVPLPLKRKSVVPPRPTVVLRKKSKLVPEKPEAKPSSSLSRSKSSPPVELLAVKAEAKEDDDAPYTPWEEEDDKDDEITEIPSGKEDPVTSTLPLIGIPGAAPSLDVQKQLRELEAKIAKEKQDIEKITGALASTGSGIPGLDGEFPEEEEKKDLPFFLRVSAIESHTEKPAGLPGLDTLDSSKSMEEVSNQESMDIQIVSKSTVPDTSPDVIIEDSSSQDDSESSKPVETPTEDAEEAYSPSAVQFSDEEISPEPEKTPSSSEPTKVIPADIIQLDDPLPPGVEESEISIVGKKVVGKFVPAMEPVEDIKIIMKKPAATIPISQGFSPSIPPGSSTTRVTDVVDLGDDVEPPPPGDVLSPPPPALKKSDSVFEEVRPVFAKTKSPAVGTSPLSSKMKININLTTKQLPSKDESKEKKVEPSSEILTIPLPTDLPLPSPHAVPPSKPPAPVSFPLRMPPPPLQQGLSNICPPLPNLQQPPPGLQPISSNLLPPNIPLHIPPPNMKAAPTPVPTSLVINLNVPPPPLINMMTRPMPPQTTMGFRPTSSPCPSRPEFMNVPPPPPPGPPPQMTIRPQRPPFVPAFNEGASMNMGPRPPPLMSGSSTERVHRDGKRGFERDRTSPELDRVERINLDRDNTRRDRDRSNRDGNRGGSSRDSRNRSFGRRAFGRDGHSSDRVRRNRSRSNERERSRSRERRHRRRSRSRSKSPLSKRWEARNKSRSPVSKRTRHRSRSASPTRRPHRSGSPFRNPSRSKSPSTPGKARHSSSSDKNTKHVADSSEDWEELEPVKPTEESSVEKQTSEGAGETV